MFPEAKAVKSSTGLWDYTLVNCYIRYIGDKKLCKQ